MWIVPALTPGGALVLEAQERVLYEAEVTRVHAMNQYRQGTVVLTSHRFVYIDKVKASSQSLETAVSGLKNIYFIKQAAIKQNVAKYITEENLGKLYVEIASGSNEDWSCAICFSVNRSTLDVCELCGVKREFDLSDSDLSASINLEPEDLPWKPSTRRGQCPGCMHVNHAMLRNCEMCGTELLQRESDYNELYLNLEFKKVNDCQTLYDLLQKTTTKPELNVSESQSSLYGIQKLRIGTKSSVDRSNELLKDINSFQQFKERASEISSLAQQITSTHHDILLGASEPADVAKQIATILVRDNILAEHGGLLTLHECFAIYNERRAIGLISPALFTQSLKLLDKLGLPVQIRQLESGLKVIESRSHNVQIRQKLLQWIALLSAGAGHSCGVSARDVSEQFKFGIHIALEELQAAEKDGDLCRDEHISGLKFFSNDFRLFRTRNNKISSTA